MAILGITAEVKNGKNTMMLVIVRENVGIFSEGRKENLGKKIQLCHCKSDCFRK